MADRIPGEFVPLDVNYSHDRAIRQAGPMAELLFVRGLAYARKMREVTGGLIPDYDLPAIAAGIPNAKRHAAELVRERLWVTVNGGWAVRSFKKWNPEPDRTAQRTGGRLGNHNKWHTQGRWSADCEFCGGPPSEDIGSDSLTDRYTDAEPIASASLPIAEREKREERERKTSSSPQESNVTKLRARSPRLTVDGGPDGIA